MSLNCSICGNNNNSQPLSEEAISFIIVCLSTVATYWNKPEE